jgi:DNA-binding SARP family transcriptional activator
MTTGARQVDWHAALEYLKAGQYEQAAAILHEAQVSSEQMEDSVLAQLLAVACRICLACSQCRDELEWHQQACEATIQREQDLNQQLQTIVDLISEQVATEAREQRAKLSGTSPVEWDPREPRTPRPGFWQRVRDRLGWVSEPDLIGEQISGLSTAVSTPLFSKKAEASATPRLEQSQLAQTQSALVVYCLGPFRVYQNDRLISEWNSLKSKAILKYLLAQPETPIVKDVLMDVFWPDATPKAARRNLHQAIYALRQTLRGEQPEFQHIRFEDDCYYLNPKMDIWLDFEEFEKHVQAGQRLEAAGQITAAMAAYGVAEGLYLDDFLEEDLYEDWPRPQRQHLRNVYLDITDRLTRYYVQQKEHIAAIALCRKLLAKDDCHEGAHRRLMRCFLAQGQRHLAVRQFQTCTQALKEELDLTPSEETIALYQRVTSGKHT